MAKPSSRSWAVSAGSRKASESLRLAEISAKHSVPVENLLSPDLVRRIMWSPPEPRDVATIADVMRAGGAREWQIGLAVDVLTDAVSRA